MSLKITFLFIGEAHHIFHALPLAPEIARINPHAEVQLVYTDETQMHLAERVREAYPGFAPARTICLKPRFLAFLQRIGFIRKRPRILLLLLALPILRKSDAVIVPERTTTAIRHFLPRTTRLIFTPHGAGDRAITFDRRDRHFDFVLVAGPKSEERMLKDGTIRPGHYFVNGYVKADLMQRLGASPKLLFGNDRPTVLYAPHFRTALSSWDKFGLPLIEAFSRQDRFNLIVAPHYRLFSDASPARREAIERLSVPGKVLIDLHSERLFDMSYTLAADIYVGDVSSQVYEFLTIARPCVFLDAHDSDWHGNPDYRFWTLGDVVSDIDGLMRALEVASARHCQYRALQTEVLAQSVGGNPAGAAERGAEAIMKFLEEGGP